MMNLGKPLLIGILVGSAICSTGCQGVRYIYRPADEQVFLVPQGTRMEAPDEPIVTDGAEGRVELEEVVVQTDSVLLPEHYFLRLYREATQE